MQQTLGIVPLSLKGDILVKINKKRPQNLKLVAEKEFELSIEQALSLLNKNIKEEQSVVGLILEGSNAITDWLKIIRDIDHDTKSNSFFHGSSNPTNALSEADWFQQNYLITSVVPPTKSTVSTTSSTTSTSSTSSIPVKVSTTSGGRKNLLKKPVSSTTKTTASVSGSASATSSTNPRKVGLRDTATTADGSRISSSALKKTSSTTAIARSKIPNATTTAGTKSSVATTIATKSRLNNAATGATATTTRTKTATSTTNKKLDLTISRRTITAAAATGNTNKKLSSATKGGIVSSNTPPLVSAGRTTRKVVPIEKKPVVITTGTSETMLTPEKNIFVADNIEVVDEEKENAQKKEEEQILDKEKEAAIDVNEVHEEEEKEETNDDTKEEELQDEAIVVAVEEDVQEPELVSDHRQIQGEKEQIQVIERKEEQEKEEEEGELEIVVLQPVPHPSTTSSSADEHDAEVAAATSNKANDATNVRATAYVLQNSGRSSSFSPNSVASLPRPETPEVDQLRLRFETIIQTTENQFIPRRPSSKMSQEFFAARIKDMKPKDPVGTKVRSMVDLFMDENLNKWEF